MKQRVSSKRHNCKACGQNICHNPSCKDPIIKSKARRLKCSTCMNVHYCSQECQHADWNVHKHVCFDPHAVSFFDLSRKTNAICPMTKRFGCHRHPRIPMNDAQMKTCEQIYGLIEALPATETRYRLSCQCDTLLSQSKDPKLCMDTNDKMGAIFIFAQCGNLYCKPKPQYSPLLMLTRIKNVAGEAYASVPYYAMKTAEHDTDVNPVLVNVTADIIERERPKGFEKFAFVLLYLQNGECKCGFKHIEFIPSAINEETGERKFLGPETQTWQNF